MLGKFFKVFLLTADIIENQFFRNTIRMPNSLDPDQARPFVGPDLLDKTRAFVRPNLGTHCLQR